MFEYNEKLLKEDVKFPLKWGSEEYKTYIFDSKNNMIAQRFFEDFGKEIDNPNIFDSLIGEYKRVIPNLNPKYLSKDGDIYEVPKDAGNPIGCVRGWGRLQKLKSPKGEKRQDNILNYLLSVINK